MDSFGMSRSGANLSVVVQMFNFWNIKYTHRVDASRFVHIKDELLYCISYDSASLDFWNMYLFRIASKVELLLRKNMVRYKRDIQHMDALSESIDIRKSIFYGDFLSPVIFITCIKSLTLILRKAKATYLLKSRDCIRIWEFVGKTRTNLTRYRTLCPQFDTHIVRTANGWGKKTKWMH